MFLYCLSNPLILCRFLLSNSLFLNRSDPLFLLTTNPFVPINIYFTTNIRNYTIAVLLSTIFFFSPWNKRIKYALQNYTKFTI